MKVKSKTHVASGQSDFLKVIKRILAFNSPPLFLITLTVAVPLTYLLTAWYLAPDKLRDPLASWVHRQGYFSAINNGGILKTLILAPLKIIKIGGGQEIPKIHIDIKFKHLQKIRQKRADGVENGYLNTQPDDYVPASIRYKNRTIPVKLRLKGDLVDHLQSAKWSFRIHVKNGEQIFGLRRFSIQAPWTRGFHSEVLFFETLRHIGVLAPRYFFLNATINGESIGIMALEEHFSKELLEHNRRREGVIIKFDESLYWNNQGPVFYNFRNVPIKAFRKSQIEKSEKLSSEYAVAVGLLRGFINKQLPASEVFDSKQMGRFLAATELWGASHPVNFTNLRLYLNPITLKLEPIAFDASIPSRDAPLPTLLGGDVIVFNHSFAREVLENAEIFEVYIETLGSLSDDIVNGSLLSKLKEVENRTLPILNREFPLLTSLPWEDLVQRAKILREVTKTTFNSKKNAFEPSNRSYSYILHTYLGSDEKGFYLEVANAIPQPVEINSIEWLSKVGGENKSFVPASATHFPLKLPATPLNTLPNAVKIYYSPYDLERYSLRVFATINNGSEPYESEAVPYFAPLKKHPIPKSSMFQQLKQHPFLTHKPEEKELLVKPGQWNVKGSLIIPEGYSLNISGNTTLRFSREAGLVSRGALRFNGTESSPIILEGPNDDKGGLWRGVAVLGSSEPSRWSFVNIRNTTGMRHTDWELTGGTTFYKSAAQLEHCSFSGHQGEDALNIVNSKFSLKNIKIESTASDGLDIDFSEGSIEGGLFKSIGRLGGGDGVDVSGSKVSINGTVLQDVSDKALSVGEQSKVVATNITMEEVGTGVASKDGSSLTISESSIKKARFFGLIAYIKKPEYGPASIDARNMKFEEAGVRARVQKGSYLLLEGEQVKAEDMDVEQLYETIMKPGLKK